MKTYSIELQRVKAMSNAHGLVHAQLDAAVQPRPGRDDGETGTTLTMTEETARVLLLLLKAQLAEFHRRKGRSQR
jgi:hypothetical protein